VHSSGRGSVCVIRQHVFWEDLPFFSVDKEKQSIYKEKHDGIQREVYPPWNYVIIRFLLYDDRWSDSWTQGGGFWQLSAGFAMIVGSATQTAVNTGAALSATNLLLLWQRRKNILEGPGGKSRWKID
jgi:hypothetical protein